MDELTQGIETNDYVVIDEYRDETENKNGYQQGDPFFHITRSPTDGQNMTENQPTLTQESENEIPANMQEENRESATTGKQFPPNSIFVGQHVPTDVTKIAEIVYQKQHLERENAILRSLMETFKQKADSSLEREQRLLNKILEQKTQVNKPLHSTIIPGISTTPKSLTTQTTQLPNKNKQTAFPNSPPIPSQTISEINSEQGQWENRSTKKDTSPFLTLNNTLEKLNDSMNRWDNSRIRCNTRYKLTRDTEFRIWHDKLTTELSTLGLLDVIEPGENLDVDYSVKQRIDRENDARAIIVSRLDKNYYKMVLKMTDPRKIIIYLKQQRQIQTNLTSNTIRTRLQKIKMHRNESAGEYVQRFEATVREYEAMDDSKELSQDELTTFFLNNVNPIQPSINHFWQGHRTYLWQDMSFERLKTTLLQIEANARERRQNVDQPKQQLR